MKRLLWVACSTAFFAGCAQQPVVTANAVPQECGQVYRTGSLIPTHDCAPKMTEDERQRLIDDLQKTLLKSGGTIKPPGG